MPVRVHSLLEVVVHIVVERHVVGSTYWHSVNILLEVVAVGFGVVFHRSAYVRRVGTIKRAVVGIVGRIYIFLWERELGIAFGLCGIVVWTRLFGKHLQRRIMSPATVLGIRRHKSHDHHRSHKSTDKRIF